ncbi:hypothetical protein C2134_02300 [Chromobacterium sinusclupearum]|jgi:hypothetical protein|uniref:Lipoprotein n=1 Tax=Chromobacterium sinusclupearum TaxID=2077146 RepID=A0A2K4MT19_9NEIS|nr:MULTISPECIES: hypothetical protein [Chromobacterium]POB00251.1 hypothetical protein C2134_02300 [Chromobacterium sinusclupearum]
MQIKTLPLLAVTVLSLSACSSFKATILPQQNNTYSAVAMADNAKDALDNAVGKANEICKDQKKKLVVLNREDESKNDGDSALTQMAKSVASYVLPIRSDQDYKTTLLFRCE